MPYSISISLIVYKKYEIRSNSIAKKLNLIHFFFGQNEGQAIGDGMMLPGFSTAPFKYGSSDDDFMDSDDATNFRPPHGRTSTAHGTSFMDSRLKMLPMRPTNRVLKYRRVQSGWMPKRVLISPDNFLTLLELSTLKCYV